MASHCSILAWRLPWTEESGGRQSMGTQESKHDLSACSSTEGIWFHGSAALGVFGPHFSLPRTVGAMATDGILERRHQSKRKRRWRLEEWKNSPSKSWWGGTCYMLSHSVVPDSCDPMDSSLPGSSVHGFLQARILEWVAISFSGGSSLPRDQTCIIGEQREETGNHEPGLCGAREMKGFTKNSHKHLIPWSGQVQPGMKCPWFLWTKRLCNSKC